MKKIGKIIILLAAIGVLLLGVWVIFNYQQKEAIKKEKAELIKQGFDELDNLRKLGLGDDNPHVIRVQTTIQAYEADIAHLDAQGNVLCWLHGQRCSKSERLKEQIALNKELIGAYQAEIEQLVGTGKRDNHSTVSYSKRKLNDALFEVARLEQELALVTNVLDSQERVKLHELITIDKQAIELQRQAIQDYYALGLADDHIKVKMMRENMARAMAQLQQWQQRLAR